MSPKSAAPASPFEGGNRFTLANGSVSAIQEMEKGRWLAERIERNESWALTPDGITRTETDRDGAGVTLFTDTNSDGVYFEALSWTRPATGAQDEQLRFTTAADGTITGIQEWDEGRWQTDRLDHNETYRFQDGLVIKTEMEKGRADWSAYADSNGDGVWTELAEGGSTLDLVGIKALLTALVADGLVY